MSHMMAKGILGGRKLMVQAIRQQGRPETRRMERFIAFSNDAAGPALRISAMRLAASRFHSQFVITTRPNIVSYHRFPETKRPGKSRLH